MFLYFINCISNKRYELWNGKNKTKNISFAIKYGSCHKIVSKFNITVSNIHFFSQLKFIQNWYYINYFISCIDIYIIFSKPFDIKEYRFITKCSLFYKSHTYPIWNLFFIAKISKIDTWHKRHIKTSKSKHEFPHLEKKHKTPSQTSAESNFIVRKR